MGHSANSIPPVNDAGQDKATSIFNFTMQLRVTGRQAVLGHCLCGEDKEKLRNGLQRISWPQGQVKEWKDGCTGTWFGRLTGEKTGQAVIHHRPVTTVLTSNQEKQSTRN